MTDTIHLINQSLARCRCGSRAVMRYEPGVTYIHCIAENETKAASGDWEPERLAREWNVKVEASVPRAHSDTHKPQ